MVCILKYKNSLTFLRTSGSYQKDIDNLKISIPTKRKPAVDYKLMTDNRLIQVDHH